MEKIMKASVAIKIFTAISERDTRPLSEFILFREMDDHCVMITDISIFDSKNYYAILDTKPQGNPITADMLIEFIQEMSLEDGISLDDIHMAFGTEFDDGIYVEEFNVIKSGAYGSQNIILIQAKPLSFDEQVQFEINQMTDNADYILLDDKENDPT